VLNCPALCPALRASVLVALLLAPSPLSGAEGGAALQAAQSPTLIGEAIDAADLAAFERLVDTDAILKTALNLFLREARKPEIARELPPFLALMFSGATGDTTGGESLRTLLLQEARAFVNNGIASGAFAGRKPSGRTDGFLAPPFADASTGRKEIREIGEAWPDGKDWLVPFAVHDAGSDERYPVLGRFSPVDKGFRLTAVENTEDLMRQIMAEAQNRIE
jgi:hypothetical protein